MVVELQPNLPVYTIKPWQGVGRNLGSPPKFTDAYHISPDRWDEIHSESEDSEYDTQWGDEGLSGSTVPSITGPVTQSQTRAHQLAQGIQDAWTKAIQYIQHR